MSDPVPMVSIGFAVYNGEPYLRQALDSILAQTFSDYELIISDNASTDNTQAICQEYAARDPRICYHRNPQNIGGANNENQTFYMARGKYFRLAAHDDVLAPSLLEKFVQVLNEHPEVNLVYCGTCYINAEGEEIGTKFLGKALSGRPAKRFNDLAFRDHYCEPTYGLIRADILRKTGLQKNYTDSDRVLLCELALGSCFYEIPEVLFFKRMHKKNIYVDWRARMSWFNPAWKGKIVFPLWLQFFDFIRTIQRVKLPWIERLLCYLVLAKWVVINAKRMFKDLVVAGIMGLHSRKWRINRAITNWE